MLSVEPHIVGRLRNDSGIALREIISESFGVVRAGNLLLDEVDERLQTAILRFGRVVRGTLARTDDL